MATIETEITSELVIAPTSKPEIVLSEKGEAFYQQYRAEVEAHVPDLTTDKGRKAIASLAFRVARGKTEIDEAGKALNEKLREQINGVDKARRDIRERFDALKEQARKPLTDWEAREQSNAAERSKACDLLQRARVILSTDTAAAIEAILAGVEQFVIDPAVFDEPQQFSDVQAVKAETLSILRGSLAARRKADEEAAELAALRADKAKRDAEALERQLREELRTAEAKKAEEFRIATEAAAERKRLADEKRRQEEKERADREAERIEQARLQAIEDGRIAHEQAIRDIEEKNRMEAAERDRKATEEADRVRREQQFIAREREDAREKAHRAEIEREREEARIAAHNAEVELLRQQKEAQIRAVQEAVERERAAHYSREAAKPVPSIEVEAEEVSLDDKKYAAATAFREAKFTPAASTRIVALIASGKVPFVRLG